jgi:hypothetical protein
VQIGLKNLEKIVRTLVEASVDTGVATGAGTNYLDDAAKSWPDNAFANLIIEITGGTGAGQIRKIASNTATRITVTPNWTTVPDATSTYRIGFYGKMSGDIASWGGTAVTGRDITQDIARLDIALSALRDAITAAAPNNKTLNDLYVRLAEVLGRNISQWGGTVLTGRDISLDLAKLDIALSALRDDLRAMFSPVSAYNSSTGAALTVILDTGQYGGRTVVEVWVKSSAAATFTVDGSRDGTNWRTVDTITLSGTGEDHRGYQNAYRYVRVSTTAANDNEIEIVASR